MVPIVFIPCGKGGRSHFSLNTRLDVSVAVETIAKAKAIWLPEASHYVTAQYPEETAAIIINEIDNGYFDESEIR
jgi:hypothetical protein